MGSKRERQISIISNNIKNCVKTSSANVYSYGNIPTKCMDGAKSSYVGAVAYHDILGLIDTTVWGSGKRGMVFTDQGVYYREVLSNSIYCPYSNLMEFSIPDNTYFDSYGLKDMLQLLFNLEQEFEESSGSNDILSGLLDIAGAAIQGAANNWLSSELKKAEVQRKQENKEAIELYQTIKLVLSEYINGLSELVQEEVNLNDFESVSSYFERLSAASVLIACKTEAVFDDDTIEGMNQMMEYMEFIDELYEADTDNEYGFEEVCLKKSANIFYHRIDVLIDEMNDGDIEFQEGYESSINEIQLILNALKKTKKNINKIIELGYLED